MRDACPGEKPEVFEGHHESDSSIATSIESVRDGHWGAGRAGHCRCCPALLREWPL